MFNHRLDSVNESATLKLNAMVEELKSRGEKIINLTAGEPDFEVLEQSKKAAIQAIEANKSKYTAVAGILELRELIAEKTNREQPHVVPKWNAKNVLVCNGAKHALFNTFMTLLNPGDEVLIPAPYWLSYPDMVKIAGGVPKFISTTFESGFKITPDQLKRALGPSVRALILNSPSNPTGTMYSQKELEALGKVLLESADAQKAWVISDEIYDRIVYGEVPFCSFLEAVPQLAARSVTVNGMSKSAAMTGWRVGWLVGPESFVKTAAILQGQSTSGINSVAQWASVAALKLPDEAFSAQLETFKKRRELVMEILSKSGRIKVRTPEGAFYAFVGVESCFKPGGLQDAIALAEQLLKETKVAVVPGTPFGEPRFIRLSFATDERSIQEGCTRIATFLERNS